MVKAEAGSLPLAMPKKVLLASSGDLRDSANINCWPAQAAMESALADVLKSHFDVELERIHSFSPEKGHGFLDSQRAGLQAFEGIDRTLPIIVAESVWQYSHHVLPGLLRHQGPILTLANWSGQWPGLVGMLNLNGGLTKAGKPYTTIWSEDFSDPLFHRTLKSWLDTGHAAHDTSHVQPFSPTSSRAKEVGVAIANRFASQGAILAVFDEGCMGMYNAIIPDEMLFDAGIYKERLSQSALLFAMSQVSDEEANSVFQWIVDRGFTFHFGTFNSTELTKEQVLSQCRMYIAAARIADSMGCDALGIQYQQGLKDMCPASDLVEGLLNNADRPPVYRADGTIIREGEPYIHFNEVDECAGLDGLIAFEVSKALGQPLENTLHDLRWGDVDRTTGGETFIWVFEISGGAPPAHHIGGYAGSHGYRQPAMYFPSGGSTCAGVARPGTIIWSRIYIANNCLNMDLGLGEVVTLAPEETQRRLDATTPVWPIMHAVLDGISRDQMMAQHKSNHIQVSYAHDRAAAMEVLQAKGSCAQAMGMRVHVCGLG